MSDKTKFWLLLALFLLSVALLFVLNTALTQQVLMHS
jgi:hypothetical protein